MNKKAVYSIIIFLTLCFLIIGSTPSLWAQAAPGEHLQKQAEQFMQDGDAAHAVFYCKQALEQYPESSICPGVRLLLARGYQSQAKISDAIATLELLRRDYPTCSELPDALVFLHALYSAGNAVEKAETIAQEVMKRWPRTPQVWQIIEARYRRQVTENAETALAEIDKALVQNVLAPADVLKARLVQFEASKATDAEQLSELQRSVLQQAAEAQTVDALRWSLAQASVLYQPLMKVKRFKDARLLLTTLRERLDGFTAKDDPAYAFTYQYAYPTLVRGMRWPTSPHCTRKIQRDLCKKRCR